MYERRSYGFEVRAQEEDAGSVITGSPVVYESRTDLGWFDEIIRTGALNNADLSDVRFLVNHDLSRIPLARCRGKGGTMQIAVSAKGMDVRVELDTEGNVDAKALYSAVKRGDISGMSFMFRIDGEEWKNLDSDHPTRIITEIGAVLEVSAVTFPAYKAALDAARRANGANLDDKALLELIKLKALYGGM